MPVLFEELRIEKFSLADRLQLVEDLWDSIASDVIASELSVPLQNEIDRRLAAHRANPDAAVSWEQAERELLTRLRK